MILDNVIVKETLFHSKIEKIQMFEYLGNWLFVDFYLLLIHFIADFAMNILILS
jgi:hypothetical protein